jgi:hypothetical protein
MNPNLANAILFQLGWFACVLGGNLLAIIWTVPYLVAHFTYISRLRGEWLFVAGLAVIGITVDSLAMAAGIFSIPGNLPFPLWLACLWVMIGTFIPHGLSWLAGRPVLATAFGAVGGCLSYYAGVRLGLAQTENLPLALTFWAIQWALIIPAALAVAQRWLIAPLQPKLPQSAT